MATIEQAAVNYVLSAWNAVVSFFRDYARSAYTDLESQVSAMRNLRR